MVFLVKKQRILRYSKQRSRSILIMFYKVTMQQFLHMELQVLVKHIQSLETIVIIAKIKAFAILYLNIYFVENNKFKNNLT
jgi:hypothetical protein